MNEVDREVLALRHFEELTNRETAQIIGISEQAASVRYMKALKRLKHVMEAVSRINDGSLHRVHLFALQILAAMTARRLYLSHQTGQWLRSISLKKPFRAAKYT